MSESYSVTSWTNSERVEALTLLGQALRKASETDLVSVLADNYLSPEGVDRFCEAVTAMQADVDAHLSSSEDSSKLESDRGRVLVMRCPAFFEDATFIEWLRQSRTATWHRGRTPDDCSDAFVLVDPGLQGEGSEQESNAFPQYIWKQIVDECKKHFRPNFGHHILVWLQNVSPVSGQDCEACSSHQSGSVVLDAPAFFKDRQFVEWLNSDALKATWHSDGEPDEWSDVFIPIPSELSGEGCFLPDPRFPEAVWDAILRECRRHYAPHEFNEYLVVWLRNVE